MSKDAIKNLWQIRVFAYPSYLIKFLSNYCKFCYLYEKTTYAKTHNEYFLLCFLGLFLFFFIFFIFLMGDIAQSCAIIKSQAMARAYH